MPFNQETLLIHTKSTIDKMGVDLASDLGYAVFVDLDDREDYVTQLQEGKDDAVVWRIADFDSKGVSCSMYSITFLIGSAIHKDVNNTKSIRTAGVISEKFPVGSSLPIFDYTKQVAATKPTGFLSITRVGLDPPVSDGMSGYRFIAISGMIVRAV